MKPLLPLGVGLTVGGLGYALLDSLGKDKEADEEKRKLTVVDQAAKDAELARTQGHQALLAREQQYYDSNERVNQSQIEELQRRIPDWQTQFALGNQWADDEFDRAVESFEMKKKQRNHELDMEAINQQLARAHNTFDNNNKGVLDTVGGYLGSAPWRV